MLSRRATLEALGTLLLVGAALPVGAAAFMAPATGPNGARRSPSSSVLLHEHVRSSGVFDVRVGINSGVSAAGVVDLQFGSVARRATKVSSGHGAVVRVRLPIHGRSLTIRASAQWAMPDFNVTLQRVPPAKPTTRGRTGGSTGSATTGSGSASGSAGSGGSSSGSSGSSGSGAGVSLGSSGSASTGSTGASGPGGSSGSSGSAGSTGSSGSSGSAGPSGSGGSTGSTAPPAITLPHGFTPTASYTSLVKDYEFAGSSLPADWVAGNDSTHGFAATIFNSTQVSMTGSSVALSVSRQSSNGYAYQSGWISTEGKFSFNYGLIDFRAKMPAGQGLWSALWLDQPDGSNPWGEIDVQEMVLYDTHTLYGSLHGWAPSDWGESQWAHMTSDASAGYHDYQLVWQPGLVTWALDGVAYAQYTEAQALAAGYPWVMGDGSGYYIIADLAAGTSLWGGPPNSTTPLPSSMLLASVKVWQ